MTFPNPNTLSFLPTFSVDAVVSLLNIQRALGDMVGGVGPMLGNGIPDSINGPTGRRVYNVKSFGAVGNGDLGTMAHDDTAAIQACFTAAFQYSPDPGTGQLPWNSSVVFFPPGIYKTTSTLTILADSGCIIGSGRGATTIKNFNPGTVLRANWHNMHISDMSFVGSGGTNARALDFGQNLGEYPQPNAGTLINVLFDAGGGDVAFIAGGGTAAQMGSEVIFFNCEFTNAKYGFSASNGNALNYVFIGGYIHNCSISGIVDAGGGSFNIVRSVTFSNNGTDTSGDVSQLGDINQGSTSPATIEGCVSDSPSTCAFFNGTLGYISDCTHLGTGQFCRPVYQAVMDNSYSKGTVGGASGVYIYLRADHFTQTKAVALAGFHGVVGEDLYA